MSYEDFTINSKNPLARLAHRSRYKRALSLVSKQSTKDFNILDFGCGDGNFLLTLSEKIDASNLVGYEPYMDLKDIPPAVITCRDWNEITTYCDDHGLFDTVTCFEVLEHFSKERQIEAINKMSTVLKDDGNIIISVPIEKGLPVIPKNLRRIALHYNKGNEELYTFKNIAYSLFGLKSSSLDDLRTGDQYLSHMGFYFTDLEDLLKENFILSKILYSPFSKLPYFFNSQVFYKLKKK